MKADILSGVREIVAREVLTGRDLTEGDLARSLGVSRTPVREALATLEEQGLLERKKYRGIRLRPPTLQDIVENYDIRTALEGMAARLLASHADEGDLARLEKLAARSDALTTEKPFSDQENQRVDIEFHEAVVGFCGNRRLKKLVGMCHLLDRSFALSGKIGRAKAAPLRFTHMEIVDTIRGGDPDEAERVIRQHIQEGKEGHIRLLLNSAHVPAGAEQRENHQ